MDLGRAVTDEPFRVGYRADRGGRPPAPSLPSHPWHHSVEPCGAGLAKGHDPRTRRPFGPAAVIDMIEQRRAERAGEVVPAFAPVEAGAAQGTPPIRGGIQIDA